MSALTQFRDHCRRMAESTPTTKVKAAWRPHLHRDEAFPVGTLSDAERALWTRLADEVDAYLAGPALPSDADHDPIDYDDPIDEYRHHRGA